MEMVTAPVDGSLPLMSGFVPPRPTAAGAGWNAPPPPSEARPADLVPSDDPITVLDELTVQVDGVAGVILASVDGFGLARSTSMADEPSHSAMLAAAVGLARQLAAMGGGETLRQLVVDHDAGLMLVWPIGSDRVLAVVASTRVDQRALRAAVRRRAATLAGVTP